MNIKIGDNYPCFIVGEVGVNHCGSVGKAKELIDIAVDAKVNAVKFQLHNPEEEMIPHPYIKSLNESIRKTELSFESLLDLQYYACNKKMGFFVTPFCDKSAYQLSKYMPILKTGSGELTNIPFLKSAINDFAGKKVFISTGMSTFSEIERVVSEIKLYSWEYALLICCSKYPPSLPDIDLTRIRILKEKFNCPVGFSDHFVSNYMSFAAVAMGTNIIEKHFTISRKDKGDDHHMSLEPDELKDLVRGIRSIEEAMKPKPWILTQDDLKMRMKYNHSIVSIRDIPKGKIIDKEDVWVKRPGIGIPPMYLEIVMGKKTVRNIAKNKLISWEDLEL